jgi:uncharacterized SAM-binding protein YcdF (DUF218 family)
MSDLIPVWLTGKGVCDRVIITQKSMNIMQATDWFMWHISGKWQKSEAQIFKDVAISQGVPEDKIILEENATNTGQNAYSLAWPQLMHE